jgi:hypothetical protein
MHADPTCSYKAPVNDISYGLDFSKFFDKSSLPGDVFGKTSV